MRKPVVVVVVDVKNKAAVRPVWQLHLWPTLPVSVRMRAASTTSGPWLWHPPLTQFGETWNRRARRASRRVVVG